ncbi:hypothetical protein D9M69_634580 [compost metagenome]
MIAGEPAGRRGDGGTDLAEAPIGLHRTVLRQIAGGQQQVDSRLLIEHQLHDLLQAVGGIHAQQAATSLGEQMAVRQLHQQYCGIGRGNRLCRQGALLL